MAKLKKLTCPHCPGRRFASQSALNMHHSDSHKPNVNGHARIPVPHKRTFFQKLFGLNKAPQPRTGARA